MANAFRKGSRVRVMAGRWQGRPGLVVGRTICKRISLSLLDSDWDSPLVAVAAEHLKPISKEEAYSH